MKRTISPDRIIGKVVALVAKRMSLFSDLARVETEIAAVKNECLLQAHPECTPAFLEALAPRADISAVLPADPCRRITTARKPPGAETEGGVERIGFPRPPFAAAAVNAALGASLAATTPVNSASSIMTDRLLPQVLIHDPPLAGIVVGAWPDEKRDSIRALRNTLWTHYGKTGSD